MNFAALGLAATVIAATSGSASGAFWAPTTAAKMLQNPQAHIGHGAKLERIACSANGNAGYFCVSQVGDQYLMIKADGIGLATPRASRDLIETVCTSPEKLDDKRCIFEVGVVPVAFDRALIDTGAGSFPATAFKSNTMDFRPVSR